MSRKDEICLQLKMKKHYIKTWKISREYYIMHSPHNKVSALTRTICWVLQPLIFNLFHRQLTVVSNLLVTVNSSVNFVIYCIFGQKFRRSFLKLICCGTLPMDQQGFKTRAYSHYGDRMSFSATQHTQSMRLSIPNNVQTFKSSHCYGVERGSYKQVKGVPDNPVLLKNMRSNRSPLREEPSPDWKY